MGFSSRRSTRRARHRITAALGAVALGAILPAAPAIAGETVTNTEPATVDDTTVLRDLLVSADEVVTDVTITVEFAKIGSEECTDPPPSEEGRDTYNNEIELALRSPVGTEVMLVAAGDYSGGEEGGRVVVTFDDAAGSTVSGTPTSGTFQPNGSLATFDGEASAGTWELLLTDTVGADPLCYYASELTVNGGGAPPSTVEARDDEATTGPSTPVDIQVLENDEGEDLSVRVDERDAPDNGTVMVQDGTITYTPNDGFVGTDIFVYEVSDGTSRDRASVTVTVTGANAVADDAYADTGLTRSIPVLANDLGAELEVTETTDPANGNVSIHEEGYVLYTSDDGFAGEDTFTYTVTSSNGDTDTAEVTVTVEPVGDLSQGCPDGEVPNAGYADVEDGNVHADAIQCVTWWDVAEGFDDGFHPDGDVTRGQMAGFIARLLEQAGVALPQDPPDAFADDDGGFFELQINQLADLKIVQGFQDGTYRPSTTVTRGQMATYLVRSFESATGASLEAFEDYFGDDDRSPHEADINAATAAGLARGTSADTFEPGLDTRRDEMASFLARVLDRLVELGTAQTP